MATLVIDIGGTKLAAASIGADGQIRDRRELPTPASQTPQALRDTLPALVSPLQAHARQVAIASTGAICDGNLLALNPYNLGGLLHFPLVRTLEQLINLPTIAINDAQAAVWAGYQALGDNITDTVLITVSIGADDGVVSGGRLRIGPGGLAGHIRHTLADPYDPVCDCGRTGCVEAIASGRGIATAAQGELAGTNAKAIFTHAGQGDEQAQQLIYRSACMLARPIADIKATTNCQYVVVDGSAGLAERYLALVEMCLAQDPVTLHADLPAAYYRHDAGLLGVALLAQGEVL